MRKKQPPTSEPRGISPYLSIYCDGAKPDDHPKVMIVTLGTASINIHPHRVRYHPLTEADLDRVRWGLVADGLYVPLEGTARRIDPRHAQHIDDGQALRVRFRLRCDHCGRNVEWADNLPHRGLTDAYAKGVREIPLRHFI